MNKALLCLFMVWGGLWTAGCTRELAGVDPNTYLVLEGGRVQRLRAFEIAQTTLLLPAPSKLMVALAERAPEGDADAWRAYRSAPPRRLVGDGSGHDLAATLAKMTGDRFNDRVKWVLGINPLIVAIGEPANPEWRGSVGFAVLDLMGDHTLHIGGNFRLVRPGDLPAKAGRLIIVDGWTGRFPDEVIVPREVEVKTASTLAEIQASYAGTSNAYP